MPLSFVNVIAVWSIDVACWNGCIPFWSVYLLYVPPVFERWVWGWEMELLRSRSASHVSLSGVSSQSSVGLVRSASQGLLSPLRALSAEIWRVLILIRIRPKTGCQSVRFCELQPEESWPIDLQNFEDLRMALWSKRDSHLPSLRPRHSCAQSFESK